MMTRCVETVSFSIPITVSKFSVEELENFLFNLHQSVDRMVFVKEKIEKVLLERKKEEDRKLGRTPKTEE